MAWPSSIMVEKNRQIGFAPVVGYSGTPLPRKLGIKEGHRVAFPGAPAGFHNLVDPLPGGVRIKSRAVAPLDLVVAFFTRRSELERRFEALAKVVFPDGAFWVAWPKRSSGVPTDLTEDVMREIALPRGLVDTKVCAIDETWSGLRLVHRVENRGR
jgi:hypothetical protein